VKHPATDWDFRDSACSFFYLCRLSSCHSKLGSLAWTELNSLPVRATEASSQRRVEFAPAAASQRASAAALRKLQAKVSKRLLSATVLQPVSRVEKQKPRASAMVADSSQLSLCAALPPSVAEQLFRRHAFFLSALAPPPSSAALRPLLPVVGAMDSAMELC
jgi:hypothetical protein